LDAIGISVFAVIGEPPVECGRFVGFGDAPFPGCNHLVVGAPEHHVRFAARLLDDAVFAREPFVKRRPRQCLDEVDRQHRNVGAPDKFENGVRRFLRIGVEAENNAGDNLETERIERRDRFVQRYARIVTFLD